MTINDQDLQYISNINRVNWQKSSLNIPEKHQQELLWIEASKNDPQGFAPLYDRYFKDIYLFVFKRIKDRELTADLTSQVFLKALLHINKYENRGAPFVSWLYRIALNEVNMYYRSGKKNIRLELNESHLVTLTEDTGLDETDKNLQGMVDAMNRLPVEHAQLIELRFFEKKSFCEIGEIYNITEANAKVRVYRVLETLRKLMNLKKKGA